MIETRAFLNALKELNYSQCAGVPCSYLEPFINYVIDDPSMDYIGAVDEGAAVAVSLGAYLAGRKTVTMCQNSGLGNMVNPLTSLNFPFRIPTLLVVTWRGNPGQKDEPQHEQMGEITPALLDVLDIPWQIFPQTRSAIEPALKRAEEHMLANQRPFAFIMPKNSVSSHELFGRQKAESRSTNVMTISSVSRERLTRTQAIQLILEALDATTAIIATTGKTGRELFTIADTNSNLYVVGGMGTASSIGLGIARCLPERSVAVFDGDGAALMKMGTLATIGFYQPKNLLHIILDNEQHDSTGGQPTVSSTVRFADVAAAVNYRNAAYVEDGTGIREALARLDGLDGPSLLHIKIEPGSPDGLGRPTIRPHEVKDRFMRFLNPAFQQQVS